MADKITLGGDRLGSGAGIQVERHNYMMNSFNLSQRWRSSMAPGILYPCLKLVATNHGTFDIDVDHIIRTIPTVGPLFGSYKFQVDFFSVPFRLYQGLLHNNPTNIGMNMHLVKLPKIHIETIDHETAPRVKGSTNDDFQINTSSLEKYLGLSGIGRKANQNVSGYAKRDFQCIPELAYYDIFKCYYANKQEEKAYVITPDNIGYVEQKLEKAKYTYDTAGTQTVETDYISIDPDDHEIYLPLSKVDLVTGIITYIATVDVRGKNLNPKYIKFRIVKNDVVQDERTYQYYLENYMITDRDMRGDRMYFRLTKDFYDRYEGSIEDGDCEFNIVFENQTEIIDSNIALTPFKLQNIDDMRSALLKANEIGDEFIIGPGTAELYSWEEDSGSDETGLPYSTLVKKTDQGITYNAFEQNGLVVKTYQSDIFNNWLNTETIDGLNGVKARTAVSTAGGSFTQDDLILHEKLYQLLNRIAVGDGTYQDWQEATYGEGAVRMCETPMYIGGMSAEIFFDEIISSSATEINGDKSPLGTLGGRGRTAQQKGGTNIHCKCDEPSYVMAICSITPRINQCQGNDWDRTELKTINDLHKPELDGIGFQDLPVEWMAWFDTILNPSGGVLHRNSAGKQTAWIHYQTAVDKSYGDFAKKDGYAFMVLNRNYEAAETIALGVKDLTTYIDPAKYNYAFAVTDLASQNFWVSLDFKIIARRKMGAQQLPNL